MYIFFAPVIFLIFGKIKSWIFFRSRTVLTIYFSKSAPSYLLKKYIHIPPIKIKWLIPFRNFFLRLENWILTLLASTLFLRTGDTYQNYIDATYFLNISSSSLLDWWSTKCIRWKLALGQHRTGL